jgi:hypothetical protein
MSAFRRKQAGTCGEPSEEEGERVQAHWGDHANMSRLRILPRDDH